LSTQKLKKVDFFILGVIIAVKIWKEGDTMTVGERIKNRRIQLGLTQEQLAEKMGYSGKSTICKAETCGDDITTAKVNKYARALKCSFEYLMGWEDNIPDATQTDEYVELIALHSQLSEEHQKIILQTIKALLNKGE